VKLQTKYSLTILALIVCVVVAFTAIIFWQAQVTFRELNKETSQAIENAMFSELEEKQKLLVRVLATALTNPVYQVDMVKIEELIRSVKEHYDVQFVVVYDREGRVIHDGTKELSLYGSLVQSISSKKLLVDKRLVVDNTGNRTSIDVPIFISDELLGGVSVGFSRDTIVSAIKKRKDYFLSLAERDSQKELAVMFSGALFFSLIGFVVSVFLGRTWSKPIQILSSLTAKVGRGEYDFVIPIHRTDELGQLADAFAGMVKNLKELREKEIDQARKIQQSNADLQSTNSELVKANKAKDEFLSIMSHELKTPLNVIMGYAELARTDTLPAIGLKPEEAINKILIHSKDLLHMVDEILQATRIEAGAARAVVENVNLAAFLDDLKISCDNPTTKELTLIWNYQHDLPATRTDRDKLKHILQNLIANAIKFTPEGSVTVSARHLADRKIVEFKVADTGIGIPPELLASIFERFRQIDASNTRTYGGVGLGLFIVKRFAEMLGGRITVESKPEEGSTFTLTLPVVSPSQNYSDHESEGLSTIPDIEP
jgi:signal transduction histidine kinase